LADVVINDNRWSIILFFVHSPPLIKRNCRLTSHTHHKNQCPHKQCCNRNVFEEWQINSLSKSFPQVLKIGRNINTYDTFSNMLCLHSDQCYLPSSMFFADNVIIWLMLTWLKNFLKGPWNLKLRNKSSYLLKLPALLQQLRRLLLILLLGLQENLSVWILFLVSSMTISFPFLRQIFDFLFHSYHWPTKNDR